jgi:hypothetical protein
MISPPPVSSMPVDSTKHSSKMLFLKKLHLHQTLADVFLVIIPYTMQSNSCLPNSYIVLGIVSNLGMT